MGVDVAHALGRDACAAEGGPHHVGHAGGLWLGLGHVMPVVRGAVAEDLRIDAGASGLRGVEVLEDEHARAFSHHEAGASRVERPRRAGRILVLHREPAHRGETREDQRVQARLAAAGEHGVGVAALDQLGSLTDRVRAGRAGGDDCVVRPRDAEGDRKLAARRVDEDVRQEVRRHPVGSALAADLLLLQDPAHAADRGPEDDAHLGRLEPLEARVGERLLGSAEGEQDVPLELAHLLRRGHLDASKSFTSAAIFTGTSPGSKERSQSMPLSPATAARQVEGASFPSGVTAPRPVTATLLIV